MKTCPLCEGKGKVIDKMPKKIMIKKIKKMRELGFSIREIMRVLNYKSPRSIQVLLTK